MLSGASRWQKSWRKMTSFAAEKSAGSARVITALAEVPSTLTGTPSTLAKVSSTDAEVISFRRKVDREW